MLTLLLLLLQTSTVGCAAGCAPAVLGPGPWYESDGCEDHLRTVRRDDGGAAAAHHTVCPAGTWVFTADY
jgi:hypothetical protein